MTGRILEFIHEQTGLSYEIQKNSKNNENSS